MRSTSTPPPYLIKCRSFLFIYCFVVVVNRGYDARCTKKRKCDCVRVACEFELVVALRCECHVRSFVKQKVKMSASNGLYFRI